MNALSEMCYSVTAILSVIAVVCNGPMQIQMNMSMKQCGQPIVAVVLSLGVVTFRFAHLCFERKWKLAVSDFIGIIVCLILIIQHWYYHWI